MRRIPDETPAHGPNSVEPRNEPEQLESHAEQQATADSTDLIRCLRCRVQRMSKEKIHFDQRPDESFQLDICRKCQMIWFDGGELAKFQLDYESSIKAIDQLERQKLAQSLSGDRKEQLEERIATMPMASECTRSAPRKSLALDRSWRSPDYCLGTAATQLFR